MELESVNSRSGPKIGARACGLKVGKFKKYRRLAIGASKSKK